MHHKRVRIRIILALIASLVIVLQPLGLHRLTDLVSPRISNSIIVLAQDTDNPPDISPNVDEPDTTSEDADAEESVTTSEDAPAADSDQAAAVELDGETLFTFSPGVAGISAAERAQRTNVELQKIADDPFIAVDTLQVRSLDSIRLIVAGEQGQRLVVTLLPEDAENANVSIDELADQYLQSIQQGMRSYRSSRTLRQRLLGGLYFAGVTIGVILLIKFLNRLFPKLYTWIRNRQGTLFSTIRIQQLQLLSSGQIVSLLIRFIQLLHWAIILLILYVYIPAVLSFFPRTAELSSRIIGVLLEGISTIWNGLINYFPNLVLIILILIATRYLLVFLSIVFKALEDERISLRGFYPEWAKPTKRILGYLFIALAVTLIIPYLPGSASGAFQGVSIFIGALVTFGSAGAISNLVGGFISLYARSFQNGDRITIEQYTGIVIEKNLLSTRLLTPNNEIITIPNSIILSASVTNYSASRREIKAPLVLHTTVTLGYDVPWRKVHEVLISATQNISGILEDPPPHVWQTSLDDFYVSYELRSYTNQSKPIGQIYSELHQAIQDRCNEADIEILSPHYSAVRDGHQITIPTDYLDNNYVAPGFRFHPLDPSKSQRKENSNQDE